MLLPDPLWYKKGPNRHSIHKKEYFALIISDQHMVAKVPALDGDCVATFIFENLTLAQLIGHTIFTIAKILHEDEAFAVVTYRYVIRTRHSNNKASSM